jgi:hypothetical protein
MVDHDDFVEISKTESILTSKDKYFKIPLSDIVARKKSFPFWFIPFLNTYPLTNYAIVNNENNTFATRILDHPIFSPVTLSKHLEIKNQMSDLCIYIKQEDVEVVINQMMRNLTRH